MEPDNIQRVYFIGIGGIGMSALARYFHERGAAVSGYDRTPSPLTRELEEQGIAIHYEDDPSAIDKEANLVIYTPAVPADHRELAYYRGHDYPVLKRSEVLEHITADMFTIAVAGTHGKTTVSSLIAHILRHSGYGCNAFLGGLTVNYQTNFWSNERKVAVVEADEYDRSFLRLRPDIAVLTAMDPDHLDIYGTEAAMQDAFIRFTGRLGKEGLLLYRQGLPRSTELQGGHKLTYSLQNPSADIYAADVRMEAGGYDFKLKGKDWTIDGLRLNTGGLHNVENAVAAAAVARQLGIGSGRIRKAMADFKGVKRRFEYLVHNDRVVYIDDYAHHPEELKALIQGARALFPGRKCTVIFQPHLYSRTRDLADGFAQSLDLADEVTLLPVYPAREAPLPGIDSGLIAGKMKRAPVRLLDKAACLEWLAVHPVELLITAGAGDIDRLTGPLTDLLKKSEG